MKKLLTVYFLLFTFFVLSQKTVTPDTNQICFPTEVGKKILLDLNELDRLKKYEILTENEIKEFETKVIKQDSIISKLEQKDDTNKVIIKSWEEKYNLVEKDNKDLRNKLKWAGIKTNIVEIVSGLIMSSIIYIQLFK
jgi:hypothetical protein